MAHLPPKISDSEFSWKQPGRLTAGSPKSHHTWKEKENDQQYLWVWLPWTMTTKITPWKINMEPANHPFRKENDLNLPSRWGHGTQPLIFRGVKVAINCTLLTKSVRGWMSFPLFFWGGGLMENRRPTCNSRVLPYLVIPCEQCKKNSGCLLYIGDNTIYLYGDDNKPI